MKLWALLVSTVLYLVRLVFRTRAEAAVVAQQGQQYDSMATDKAQTETATRTQRAEVATHIEQAATHDPATADFLNAPLPDGLRHAYLEANASSGPTDSSLHGTDSDRGSVPVTR